MLPNFIAKPKADKKTYFGDQINDIKDISSISLRRPVDRVSACPCIPSKSSSAVRIGALGACEGDVLGASAVGETGGETVGEWVGEAVGGIVLETTYQQACVQLAASPPCVRMYVDELGPGFVRRAM